MLTESVLDTIGNTPLVRLRIGADRGVRVYAKLEMQNLFAMKDRVAKNILLTAKANGTLEPGAHIVESSSGTMALGVALVGTALGHPVHIVTDPRIDRITLAKLESMGCDVHVVKEMDEHGWQGARLTRLAELMKDHLGAFWPKQYENPDNPAAYRALAEELAADLETVDVLVGSVGSGGSLCGTSRALRESQPGLHVIGVDCVGSVLFGQPDWPHRLQSGLGNSMHPRNLDHSMLDEVHWLNDHEAFGAARELAREEKLFAGNTSGSVYRVLSEVARRADPGTTVVGIFPDRGDRYVDTVHSDEHWAAHQLADRPAASEPRQVVMGTPVSTWSHVLKGPDAPKPHFVFVESNTTGSGMLALSAAARLGFEPVLLAGKPERYTGLADTGATVVVCDTNDRQALRAALSTVCADRTIAGVSTTSEFYLTTAAWLARQVGLPATDAETLAGCRDKSGLRGTLAAAGIGQPRFAVAHTATEAASAAVEIGLPCVVKPVDDSGSTGVLLCATAGEAEAAAGAALARTVNGRGQPTAGAVLVEEYLDAPEFSVEMFSLDGEHHLLGVVAKTVTGAPNFVESQHILPAPLSADDMDELVTTVRKALTATGILRGPTHTEVKLTPRGAAIIEINPRLAGGMIPDLFAVTTGVDLLESQIRHAAGLDPVLPEAFDGYAGIRFLLPSAAGVLSSVGGVEEALAVPHVTQVVVKASPGTEVAPPTDAYGRVGHVIAHGPTPEAVTTALEKAVETITLHLD